MKFFEKHRDKIFTIWAKFHIVFIVLTSIYIVYDKYCSFYKYKESKLVNTAYAFTFLNTPFKYYGKLTGAGAAYGFFAPNVRTNGVIIGDCDGQKITGQFKNFEAMMRFSVLSSRISNNLIDDSGEPSTKQLEDKYMNLLFKSIAVKIYNQNNCTQDTIRISYNLLAFPTLPEYAAGDRKYYLVKLKEVKLTK